MNCRLALLLCCWPLLAASHTIAEKKASLAPQQVAPIHAQLTSLRQQLQRAYANAQQLHAKNAPAASYQNALSELQRLRSALLRLQKAWQAEALSPPAATAVCDPGATTLGQLVAEYGDPQFLYLLSPEIAALPIHLHSALPIPQTLWPEIIERILEQNGIGIQEVHPYARQLYFLKREAPQITHIACQRQQLLPLPPQTRLLYLLTPPTTQMTARLQFLQQFADRQQAALYPVAGKIALIAAKREIERLLDLYEAVWQQSSGQTTRIVALSKLPAKEMEELLKNCLATEHTALRILPFANALLLSGPAKSVTEAQQLIEESEDQLHKSSQATFSLYSCRHSAPQDLAAILDQAYAPLANAASTSRCCIPAPQTGQLLLIARGNLLPRLQQLLAQLDVPQKMVQIDVLLFERNRQSQNSGGLNLLQLQPSSGEDHYCATYQPEEEAKGMLQFLCHGSLPTSPSYKIAYHFLMSQRGMELNAAPSITTVNQTPATISIQEEMSIHTGSTTVNARKGVAMEKIFTRASYGTQLVLTPIVHPPQTEEQAGTITLRTDITFETTRNPTSGQPLVQRRRIENEVRVTDGETIVLGWLRRHGDHHQQQKVPFLGTIPGLGKLFGSRELTTDHSEMLFLITPRIMPTATAQRAGLEKRPGDIPELLQALAAAKRDQQQQLLRSAFHSLSS